MKKEDELIINQWKEKGREDSFWYDGIIASIGKYLLIACGEIRIKFPDEDNHYSNGQAVEEAEKRGYKDKDLKKVEWINNNWFEVVKGTEDENGILHIEDCMDLDVAFDYDEAIDKLLIYYNEKVYEENNNEKI